MANILYNGAKKGIADSSFDWVNDTIVCMLIEAGYTPNPDHATLDMGGATDPVDVELAGTGYARKVLTGKVVTQDDANDVVFFDADDITWTAINAGTPVAAIIYKRVGVDDTTPADDILIAYIDSGFPVTTNGGDMTLQFSSSGVIQLA